MVSLVRLLTLIFYTDSSLSVCRTQNISFMLLNRFHRLYHIQYFPMFVIIRYLLVVLIVNQNRLIRAIRIITYNPTNSFIINAHLLHAIKNPDRSLDFLIIFFVPLLQQINLQTSLDSKSQYLHSNLSIVSCSTLLRQLYREVSSLIKSVFVQHLYFQLYNCV